MQKFVPRKFKAKINESGFDDFGASGMIFPVSGLTKGQVYEEQNPRYLSTKQTGVVIDDNGCWWHYGTASFNERFELVED